MNSAIHWTRVNLFLQHDGIDSDMEKEKISIEEANRPMPIPKDGFSFEILIRNRKEVEFFREFLSKKHSKGNLLWVCWRSYTFYKTSSLSMGLP